MQAAKIVSFSGELKIHPIHKLSLVYFLISTFSLIRYTDLAGHERYLKTTLYGLTSGAPSCVILIVGANAGLIGMSKEHLAIALALSVPVVVCITKVSYRLIELLLLLERSLREMILYFHISRNEIDRHDTAAKDE